MFIKISAFEPKANEVVEYWKITRAMVAPNGKLVVFDREFRVAGGGNVYVAEAPLR